MQYRDNTVRASYLRIASLHLDLSFNLPQSARRMAAVCRSSRAEEGNSLTSVSMLVDLPMDTSKWYPNDIIQ